MGMGQGKRDEDYPRNDGVTYSRQGVREGLPEKDTLEQRHGEG
jgi:hypothetical protein